MKKIIPPIKYYGGKYFMTNLFIANFPKTYNCYVEVFGGSASLLFAKPITPNEIYNDLEKGVYSLFKCLSCKEYFKQLKDKLDLTYYHLDIRNEAKNSNNVNNDIIDRAYNFFITNRMSYNGVGGFSRNFVVRRGMSKSTSDFLSSIERLPEIHQRLSKVIIENRPWKDILDYYDKKNNFMYLDPPYLQSTRKSPQKYKLDMTEEEHIKLIERLLIIKAKILLSGYDNNIYQRLISNGWIKINFPSPNTNSNSIETIWKNY